MIKLAAFRNAVLKKERTCSFFLDQKIKIKKRPTTDLKGIEFFNYLIGKTENNGSK